MYLVGPMEAWFCTVFFCPDMTCMSYPMCVYVCVYVYVCMICVYTWVGIHAPPCTEAEVGYPPISLSTLSLWERVSSWPWRLHFPYGGLASLGDPPVSNPCISGVTDECGPTLNLILASWTELRSSCLHSKLCSPLSHLSGPSFSLLF